MLVVADLELRGLTHRRRADHVDAALAAPLLAEALDLGREVGLAHPRPRDRERMMQRLVLQRRGRAQDLLLGRRFDRLDRVDQLARVDDLDSTEAAGQMIEHRPRDLRRADDPDPPRPQRPQRIESQLGVVAVAGAHRGEARRRQHPPDAVQDRIVGRHRPVAADRPVDDRGHRLGRREHQRHRVAAAGRQPGEPAGRATEAVDVAVDEQRVDLRVGHPGAHERPASLELRRGRHGIHAIGHRDRHQLPHILGRAAYAIRERRHVCGQRVASPRHVLVGPNQRQRAVVDRRVAVTVDIDDRHRQSGGGHRVDQRPWVDTSVAAHDPPLTTQRVVQRHVAGQPHVRRTCAGDGRRREVAHRVRRRDSSSYSISGEAS